MSFDAWNKLNNKDYSRQTEVCILKMHQITEDLSIQDKHDTLVSIITVVQLIPIYDEYEQHIIIHSPGLIQMN